MNKMHFLFSLVVGITLNSVAKAGTSIESIFVDAVKDCAVISSSTDQAPIDFYEAECKAFAGFRFRIQGGDLRYGPQLSYQGTDVPLERPFGFYDLADSSIEWIYQRDVDEEGAGEITWKGLIYSLSVSDDEGSVTSFYAVRLQEGQSCLVAVVSDQEGAKKSLLDSTLTCK